MAYSDIALLAVDTDFINRVGGCAATEPDLNLDGQSPILWANQNAWIMAGAPGFGEKYAYALQTGVERPGNDPAVISDAEILSAVQAVTG